MASTADFVWMDGKVVPWKEATVHVSAETVLRGANVFEGMRAYWNDEEKELYIFKNREHLRRLRQSTRIMRMSVPYSDDELTQAFIDVIRANRFTEGVHFRPVVYFGEGEAYAWKPEEIRTGVFVLAYARPHLASIATGVKSCVSTWRRNSDNATPSRVKAAANYHNSRFATVEAKMNGFGPPIMLNDRGEVAESPGACFMMVRDGRVITPPVTADILESITRQTLIDLYRDELGVEVIERDIDRTELYVADETFFCGSGAEVQPITAVDHYAVGDGKVGPLTKKMQDLYFEIAKGKVAKYRHWLTPVYGNQKPR
ncbi:MAG: branched-chain amino acid transaminase [Alphaproteobacteria bacterium]|nr:branched-chain amino acid transaminase [Alphaproteobacteria bacterium]